MAPEDLVNVFCKNCDETGWVGYCDCDPDRHYHCRGMGSCGTHECLACTGEGVHIVTAYTIGNRKSYDPDLVSDRHVSGEKPVRKIGCHPEWEEPYDGGWVWRTREDAEAFIDTGPFADSWPFDPKVYGLVLPTSWEADASPEPDPTDGAHRLLTDSILVQLP